MDDHNDPARRSNRAIPEAPGAPGGTVEPANRAAAAIQAFQTPEETTVQRYELRDPFTDLTYRTDRFQDMVAKADQLGANRFVFQDAQGNKSFVHKVDGRWSREERRSPPVPEVTDPPRAARPERTQQEAATPAIPLRSNPTESRARESTDPQAVARMDAQAERTALVAKLEAALMDRYLIKRAPVTLGEVKIGLTEYRFKGDTSRVAFTESTFRLATDTNSPSVARSMVDLAEARNWHSLRVSGNEEFKRAVWLEAAARGVKALGYEPNPADLERLKAERELRHVNRIEPTRDAPPAPGNAANTDKPSGRGSGGRKTVLAAIEAILVTNRVPEKRREAVMAAAAEQLAQRARNGQTPKVKVYDKAAPSQRPAVVPKPEQQRTRERAAPAR
ncbi:MAG: LPD7 domain-containing protein [Hydrogenophaga sp.]|nr:LPD7 domain-containing protein [Hydrogenophaga sp.]